VDFDGAIPVLPLLVAIGQIVDLGTEFIAINRRHIPHRIRLVVETLFQGSGAILSSGVPGRFGIVTRPQIAMPPLAGQIS
jgi:hypothetical protein